MILLPTITLTGVSQPVSLQVHIDVVNRVILSNKSNMVIACSSGAKVVRLQPFSADLLMLDAPALTLLPETPLIISGVTPTMEMVGVAVDEVLGESFPASVSSAVAVSAVNVNSTVKATVTSNAGQNVILVPDTSKFNIGDAIMAGANTIPLTIISIVPGTSLTVATNLVNAVNPNDEIIRVGFIALVPSTIVALAPNTSVSILPGNGSGYGQHNMAASMSVVLASDQTVIPVNAIPVDGNKTTYSAASSFATQNAATDFWSIYGSASKIIRITKLSVQLDSAGAAIVVLVLAKRSTVNTGGTSALDTGIPHDSNDAVATATVRHYTVNPTGLGTIVGVIKDIRYPIQIAGGTTVYPSQSQMVWGERGKAIVLRGVGEGLVLNLVAAGVVANAAVNIEWTEE